MFLANVWNQWSYSVNTDLPCLPQFMFSMHWLDFHSWSSIYYSLSLIHLFIHMYQFTCSFILPRFLKSLLCGRCHAEPWAIIYLLIEKSRHCGLPPAVEINIGEIITKNANFPSIVNVKIHQLWNIILMLRKKTI